MSRRNPFSRALAARGSAGAAADAESAARRTIVPARASRSLWFAAAWTGAGAAVTGAVVGIAAVALTWLPASGASGHTESTLKAGLLTFLAALHGGVTVDGASASFVPLGLTLLAALILYRAGTGLGDVAETLEERDAVRIGLAAGVQCVAFTAVCVGLALEAGLGSSSVPPLGVGAAALVLSALAGGCGLARASALGDALRRRRPLWFDDLVPSIVAVVATYLGVGALLAAGSLALHHTEVTALSRQVGDGWAGVPVLLLGLLAVPNAVLAATSYVAGPGFAVGAGTHVGLTSAPHGLLPAFPVLGALPGQPAGPLVWVLTIATPLLAGWLAVRVLPDRASWGALARDFAAVAAVAGVLFAVLAWQAGGGIGTGRLATVGASPWQLALAVGAAALAAQWAVMGALAAREWQRQRRADAAGLAAEAPAAVVTVPAGIDPDAGVDGLTAADDDAVTGADDPAEADELAG